MSQHRQCDVAVPANPRTDFVFIQACFLFGLFEALLDRPATSGDANDRFQRCAFGCVGEEVSQVVGIAQRSADQKASCEVVVFGIRPGDERPIIKTFAFQAGTARELTPDSLGHRFDMFVNAGTPSV